MDNTLLKYIINAALFVDMCAVIALGIVLGFIVPTGSGPGVTMYFLWIHMHQWAEIHLILVIFLLILLPLHLLMNWTWVRESTKHYFGDHWKKFLFYLSGSWIFILIICWILLKI